jgi:AbiU2
MQAGIAYDTMLRRIHDYPDVIPTFNDTVEGNRFKLIQHGLIQLYILSLTRCYDSSSKNRASLPPAIELLRDREVFEAITYRARSWHADLADQNQRMAQKRARAAITRYDRVMGDAAFNVALTSLRQHRNSYLAHSLFRMNDPEPLLFGYLSDVLRETLPMIADLDFVASGVNRDPDDSIHIWEQYADEFWRRTLPADSAASA